MQCLDFCRHYDIFSFTFRFLRALDTWIYFLRVFIQPDEILKRQSNVRYIKKKLKMREIFMHTGKPGQIQLYNLSAMSG